MGDRGSWVDERRQGVSPYLGALREHWLLVVVLVAVAVGAAVAYNQTAQKRYEAEADLLVTPVSTSDDTFVGFSLLRDTGGSQDSGVLTAARLITAPQLAVAVKQKLGLPQPPSAILGDVSVTPLGQSNILVVKAESSSPRQAADLANAFAGAFVTSQTTIFQQELTETIRRIRARLQATPSTAQGTVANVGLEQRLGALSGLVGLPDPTVRVATQAVPPPAPAWPRPVLSTAIAAIASLLLAIGIAVALELVSPKINREDELLLVQRLPILARVPRLPRRLARGYLAGKEPLPGDAREAYRTLRAALATAGPGGGAPSTILVTSASPGEGKTMTAVNLALTLSLSGQHVVLVDGDLRRPMVATVFGIAAPQVGVADVFSGHLSAEDALVQAPGGGDRLRLMLARPEHAHAVDMVDPLAVARVLDELKLVADAIVIDSAPLTEVSDALSLADDVDAVLIATRLGRTRRDRLNELRRILARRGIAPAGFVVTSRRRARGRGYYYGHEAPQELPTPSAPVRRAAAVSAAGGETRRSVAESREL